MTHGPITEMIARMSKQQREAEVAKRIRHSLLNGTATMEDIARGDHCDADIFDMVQLIKLLRQ